MIKAASECGRWERWCRGVHSLAPHSRTMPYKHHALSFHKPSVSYMGCPKRACVNVKVFFPGRRYANHYVKLLSWRGWSIHPSEGQTCSFGAPHNQLYTTQQIPFQWWEIHFLVIQKFITGKISNELTKCRLHLCLYTQTSKPSSCQQDQSCPLYF